MLKQVLVIFMMLPYVMYGQKLVDSIGSDITEIVFEVDMNDAVEGEFEEYYHENYDWDSTRKAVTPLTDLEMQQSAVIVLDKRTFEILETEDGYEMIVTKHRIVRVFDDKGIDYYNKVYVPMNGVEEVISIKARSISPSGEVIVLNEDNIKNLDNYEDYGSFTLFAIEGVEKGGEIEYIYTVRKSFEYYGVENFQTWVGVKKADFQFISAKKLKWKFHGYNGFPEVDLELNNDLGIRMDEVIVENIPALPEEEYSAFDASTMRIGYKLHMISPQNKAILTWDDAASHYFGVVHADVNSATLAKFIKGIKLNKKATEQELILQVEDYVKCNIAFKEEYGTGYSDPNLTMTRKYGNELGLTRLYVALFDALDIKFKVVVGCGRYDAYFTEDFEDFTNLDEFYLYFPQYDKYLAPTGVEYRLGMAPSHIGSNKALFINSQYSGYVDVVSIGGMNENQAILDAELIVDPSMEFVTVKKKQEWLGYRAIQYRGIFAIVDEDQENQIVESIVASSVEDGDIQTAVLSHRDINDGTTTKPLTLEAVYTSEALMENAGNFYLLKVGEVIGTQSELYQETERITDIEFPFPNQYKHHIYFKIPDGYTVNGLEDIVINKQLVVDGKVLAQFVSSYKIKDGYVVIDVHEFYREVHYPKAFYNEFREVINAASDFQKVILVLEKK